MELSLKEIYSALGKEEKAPDLIIKGVSTDSRLPQKDHLFVAIKGERFDGHDFLWPAYENGCIAAIVQFIPPSPPPIPLIVVDDTVRALGVLAGYYRGKFSPLCFGITGSTGKTTTKEMLAHILQAKFSVLKTEKNYNTEIGVPLTLFQLNVTHSALVVEMAMRGKGQIAWLAEIAKPKIGIITNIGPAHLEFFKSVEEVAEAKAELLQALPPDGIAILNSDDSFFPFLKSRSQCEVITFGMSTSADVSAEVLSKTKPLLLRLKTFKGDAIVEVPIEAEHDVLNLLSAVAASLVAGLSLEEIKEKIPTLPRPPMRMELLNLPPGILVINDAYNSNPASLKAALMYLKEKSGRKIAVLGDMLELGENSEKIHYEAGKWVVDAGVDFLITVGKLSQFIGKGAEERGMSSDQTFYCGDREEALFILHRLLEEGDVVLVKASRKLELDKLVEELIKCHSY